MTVLHRGWQSRERESRGGWLGEEPIVTKDKAQKRAVRARMAKTGERYTTARLYLLDLHQSSEADTDGVVAVSGDEAEGRNGLPPRVADPGMSDEAIQRSTGRSWDEWLALLDAWNGTAHTHTEIARHVHETYGINGWWAQGVTVGYERARGMRALHERPDGFSMNVSKTFPVPVERLLAAFVEPAERARWLDGIELRLRTSQPNKSARFDVLPSDVRLSVYFTAKGPEKTSVALQMERLPSAAEVARWKTVWKDQLSFLATYLAKTVNRPDNTNG